MNVTYQWISWNRYSVIKTLLRRNTNVLSHQKAVNENMLG